MGVIRIIRIIGLTELRSHGVRVRMRANVTVRVRMKANFTVRVVNLPWRTTVIIYHPRITLVSPS